MYAPNCSSMREQPPVRRQLHREVRPALRGAPTADVTVLAAGEQPQERGQAVVPVVVAGQREQRRRGPAAGASGSAARYGPLHRFSYAVAGGRRDRPGRRPSAGSAPRGSRSPVDAPAPAAPAGTPPSTWRRSRRRGRPRSRATAHRPVPSCSVDVARRARSAAHACRGRPRTASPAAYADPVLSSSNGASQPTGLRGVKPSSCGSMLRGRRGATVSPPGRLCRTVMPGSRPFPDAVVPGSSVRRASFAAGTEPLIIRPLE